MLRNFALAALALVLILPAALAGPVRDAAAPALAGAHAVPCATPDPATENGCDTTGALLASVNAVDLSPAAGAARDEVCPSPEPFACRQMAGHPVAGGALDVCVVDPVPVVTAELLWHAVNGGNFTYTYLGQPIVVDFGAGADATMRGATSAALAGTPLAGESICHDHWDTARDVLLFV